MTLPEQEVALKCPDVRFTPESGHSRATALQWRISSVWMLLHRTCEDCSASPSLGDLESGVSQPPFWLLSNVQTNFNGTTTTHTQAGWTAGAGVEWAFADNWTAKVEWLYVNLGNGTVNCATTACFATAGGPIPVSVTLTENLIRAGVNFKFSF